MKRMILWGATGQAKVLRECMQSEAYKLVALFDNCPDVVSPFPDVPIYYGAEGFDGWLARNHVGGTAFLVAIGGCKGKERRERQQYLASKGLTPLVARHPTAFVANDVAVGPGSQILACAAVCVETTIGRACIINTGATVDHECCLEDGVHICPGAHLAGCVVVGEDAMIGTGAIVLPRIRLGKGAIVGAGAVVIEDVPPSALVVGNPARIVRRIAAAS